ncbi:MAG: translation initiation factor IF-2 [Candidatus Omnitrophica bacterium]|nr:translation initiation factor IF-2 [Candidatus Omnitrophota bacterium]
MVISKKEKVVLKKTVHDKEKKTVKKTVKVKVVKKPAKAVAAPKIKKIVLPKQKEHIKKEPVKVAVKEQVSPKPVFAKKIEVEVLKPSPVVEEPKKIIKETPSPVVKEEVKKTSSQVPPKITPKEQVHTKIAPAKPKIEEVKVAPPVPPAPVVDLRQLKEIEIELPITVKDLSIRLQEKPSIVIKNLMNMGIMVGINHSLDEETAVKICDKFNCKIKKAPDQEELALGVHQEAEKAENLHPRSPIVTFMGHVDHGKTSLLDAIRKTKVVDSEHGGITQHIGAYKVSLPHGEITFLDTPGHEAFTAMRARGASITDIVVLVVAADDGIMPQTQEAIDHAKAAGVPIIVAANKIDKPQANLDRVKKQLAEFDLRSEDWGGKTIVVPVSAKTGEGIDSLLEMILLEAQMLELKADSKRLARGIVIEAKMSKGRGPVVTLLVKNGTLHLNQNIIVGNLYGKIRAMFNDRGASVTQAGPSAPVEVLGISGIPEAGEQFFVISDEKQAKELAALRMEKERQQQIKTVKRINLEDLHAQISAGKLKELKIIIKADVQGSLEAIKDVLSKLDVPEIKVDIIHIGVGNINSSDVILAVASNALIVGFNVIEDDLAKEAAVKEGIEIRKYNIIYELGNEIKAAVVGMLEPKLKKVFLGRAEIRKVFKLSRSGIIAGCFVTKGKFHRNCNVSLVRNGEVIFEGKLSSLKRFKDDVKDVAEGFECGMSIAGYDQVQDGDIIEGYEIEKIFRKI